MTEAVSTSETSVNFYEIARREILEDSQLHIIAVREPKISQNFFFIINVSFRVILAFEDTRGAEKRR
jgi:hypothetical protein